MDTIEYGYPKHCTKCESIGGSGLSLHVSPYYRAGDKVRLMLIGQDPTIYKNPERVAYVLMLNQKNGQLSRWLEGLFGDANFQSLTLYATNLVKCSFTKPPSTTKQGGFNFIKRYFDNCRAYLNQEITMFKPTLVLTLGGSTHKLFISMLSNYSDIPEAMKEAFTGRLIKAKLEELEFDYSPCLHIKTFRVADVYGDKVRRFKEEMADYFGSE